MLWRNVRETADGLKEQDLVALKRACGTTWEVVAVGRVIGAYEWIGNFEDVEGWGLQHARQRTAMAGCSVAWVWAVAELRRSASASRIVVIRRPRGTTRLAAPRVRRDSAACPSRNRAR